MVTLFTRLLWAADLSWHWHVLAEYTSTFLHGQYRHVRSDKLTFLSDISFCGNKLASQCVSWLHNPLAKKKKYCIPLYFDSNKHWEMADKLFFFFLLPYLPTSTQHSLRGTWKEDWKFKRRGGKGHRKERHVIIHQDIFGNLFCSKKLKSKQFWKVKDIT